jgi:hypothetical protein
VPGIRVDHGGDLVEDFLAAGREGGLAQREENAVRDAQLDALSRLEHFDLFVQAVQDRGFASYLGRLGIRRHVVGGNRSRERGLDGGVLALFPLEAGELLLEAVVLADESIIRLLQPTVRLLQARDRASGARKSST